MGPTLFLLIAGFLMIGYRRPLARDFKQYRDTFDRAYDEDGLAWWTGFMGWVLVGFAVVFGGIWLFG